MKEHARFSVILTITLLGTLAFAISCRRNPPPPSPQQVRDILARGAPFSESSFYACLLNYYQQGLPLKQIQEECETKLAFDDQKGFGERGSGLTGPFARTNKWFDPASVTAVCHSGDSTIASGDVIHSSRGLLHVDDSGKVDVKWIPNEEFDHTKAWDAKQFDLGTISAGGAGVCGSNFCYEGLTKDQSEAKKVELIDAAIAAIEAWTAAKKAADADPENKEKKQAADKKLQEADKALVAAKQDPNKGPKTDDKKDEKKKDEKKKDEEKKKSGGNKGNSQPVGPGESQCEQALQAAREVVGECQRTGWRSGPCQSLWAKLNKCPEPELIYVDPESGYACGAKIDPEQLKQAFVERCRQLKRPTPGGPDPCVPPSVDSLGRYITGNAPDDMCNNPYARLDPDSTECLGTLTIQSFSPDPQQLLVWGLNKLGGPIVVLNPKTGAVTDWPSPKPKPDPVPR